MEILQGSDHHLALVYDEYGHFEGIITSGDILEAITGTVAAQTAEEPALIEREDGSLLVSGWMPADEFCDRIGLPRDLAAALDALQDNAALRGLVGDAFCQLFLEIKRAEWDAYSQQVSDWELQRYAGFF